jgi:hypothetical protein
MIKIQPFGPTIGKWKLDNDIFQELLQITDDLIVDKDKAHIGHLLVGQVKGQFEISIDTLKERDILSTFLDNALQYFEICDLLKPPSGLRECNVNMEQCWVNSMYKHDYQPPHVHNLDLSAIIILKLPDELKKPEGDITFINSSLRPVQEGENGCYLIFPEVKDFYLFPARLFHTVNSFSCEGERRTISFNIKKTLIYERIKPTPNEKFVGVSK